MPPLPPQNKSQSCGNQIAFLVLTLQLTRAAPAWCSVFLRCSVVPVELPLALITAALPVEANGPISQQTRFTALSLFQKTGLPFGRETGLFPRCETDFRRYSDVCRARLHADILPDTKGREHSAVNVPLF